MVFVWRGMGFLAFVIGFLVFLLVALAVSNDYWEAHCWPKLAAGAIAAPVIWFIGRYLNTRPGKAMIDKDTGKEVLITAKHDLFYIPVEWWGPIFAVIGIIACFTE